MHVRDWNVVLLILIDFSILDAKLRLVRLVKLEKYIAKWGSSSGMSTKSDFKVLGNCLRMPKKRCVVKGLPRWKKLCWESTISSWKRLLKIGLSRFASVIKPSVWTIRNSLRFESGLNTCSCMILKKFRLISSLLIFVQFSKSCSLRKSIRLNDISKSTV